MSKSGTVQSLIDYNELKLCKLQEWMDATDEERELIEDELSVEYNIDLSDE